MKPCSPRPQSGNMPVPTQNLDALVMSGFSWRLANESCHYASPLQMWLIIGVEKHRPEWPHISSARRFSSNTRSNHERPDEFAVKMIPQAHRWLYGCQSELNLGHFRRNQNKRRLTLCTPSWRVLNVDGDIFGNITPMSSLTFVR